MLHHWVLALGMLIAALPSRALRAETPFRAGAAAVKITPSLDRTVYLAGLTYNRRATGVHDDLYARALVVERGGTRIALVALDLIGVGNERIRSFTKQIRTVPAGNVVIACTHTHSGPDTLGLFGPNPVMSGMDGRYMKFLGQRIAQAVDEAAGRLQPARITAGVAPIPPHVAKNIREPIIDPDVHVVRFLGDDGKTIASLMHFGCHPECLWSDNKLFTADYVGYARQSVEAAVGGTAIFFNGALGGMVTADVRERTFAEAERVGEGVGSAALEAIRAETPVEGDALAVHRKNFRIPGTNDKFLLLHSLGVLPGRMAGRGVETEVARIDLGSIRMVTVPGEVLPKPALELKKELAGPAPLILALGEDELGYILDPDDWSRSPYHYERSMSIGKETWPRILAAERALLAQR